MTTLYYSKTSPFARKVRVALIEVGMAEQVTEVAVDPFANPAELIAANPLGRIPTLVLGDGPMNGQVLTESQLILDYINQQSGQQLVADASDWASKAKVAICEGIMTDSFAIVLEKRRPENEQSPAFIERRYTAIERALQQVASYALHNDSVLSGLDIATGVSLAYLDFRLPETAWREHCPRLVDWFEQVSQRPSMQQTQPPA